MKAFPFSLLNSDELCTSTERINHITEEIGANDPFIGQVRQLMAESSQALSNAIGSSRSSDFTGRLLESDGQRDSAFIGLRDYAKAFANHRDPEKAGAGKKLVDLIQQRGWSLYRQGYMVETSQLNALIADLESESYTPAIQLVGAETWLTDLKETQNAFELLYQEKVDTESGEEYPLVRESRKKVVGYLSSLLSYIDMKAELESEVYNPVVEKIDEVITDVVTVARARQTRKANDKNDENN